MAGDSIIVIRLTDDQMQQAISALQIALLRFYELADEMVMTHGKSSDLAKQATAQAQQFDALHGKMLRQRDSEMLRQRRKQRQARPELLEALREMCDACVDGRIEIVKWTRAGEAVYEQARAVLAEATGETES